MPMPPMPSIADRVLEGEDSLTIVSRSVQWRVDIPKIFNQKTSCSRTFKLASCTWCLELELKEKRHQQTNSQLGLVAIHHSKIFTLNLSLLNPENLSVQAKFLLRIAHTNMTGQSCFSINEKHFKSGDCTFEHSNPLHGILDKRVVIDFEFFEVKISNDKELASKSLGEELTGLPIQVPLNCLSRMFTESLYADVIINTKDGTLRAHRAVLAAASSVFACMFDNDFNEKLSSTIDILDMSFECCKAFLGFLYGALKEEDFWVHRCSLLEASHKYGITKLQNICEERLIEDISLSNVLERLSQAHFYELKNLKKGCFGYLFDLGRVYDIVDEFSRFTLSADQGLSSEIIWLMLAKLH